MGKNTTIEWCGHAMKERPILFSGPMVRAILAGRKTMTRRIVKPQPEFYRSSAPGMEDCSYYEWGGKHGVSDDFEDISPYGKPGDRLWVRETFAEGEGLIYRADWVGQGLDPDMLKGQWRPSIYMPRRASRITLGITGVRCERLNEISEWDARREGAYLFPAPGGGYRFAPGEEEYDTARQAFRNLWGTINGPGSWESNPWVWVVAFRRIES